MIKLDIKVGDIILTGKWRNKRTEVKEIGTDDLGQPTINGKPILKFRIEKKMPKKKINENKKLKNLRLYEEFNSTDINIVANTYLRDILDGKLSYQIISPASRNFYVESQGEDSETKQEELILDFKDPEGNESNISVDFSFSFDLERSRFRGNYEQPADPDEIVLTDISILKTSYYNDAKEDGDFSLDENNTKKLKAFIINMMNGIDQIKLK